MSFGPKYQREVLATALLSPHRFRDVKSLVTDSKFFKADEHRYIWAHAQDCLERSGELPTMGMAVEAFRDLSDPQETAQHVLELDAIRATEVGKGEAVMTSLHQAVTSQLQKTTIERAFAMYQKGDEAAAQKIFNEARGRMPKAYDQGFDTIDWADENADRFATYEREAHGEESERRICLSTGVPGIDRLMGGGVSGREILGILGITNMGKSATCVHLDHAFMAQGAGGVYISSEMHASRVAMRKDSRHTGFVFNKFKNFDFTDVERAHIEEMYTESRKLYARRSRIVSAPNETLTTSKIMRIIDTAREELDNMQYFIVDCGQHIIPDHVKHQGIKERNTAASWFIDSLAEETGLVGVVSLHANREGKDGTSSENIADDYNWSRSCDWIICLNEVAQSMGPTPRHDIPMDEEYSGGVEDPNAARTLVWTLGKSRDGAKGDVPVSADFARMLIQEHALTTNDEYAGEETTCLF